MTVYGLYGTRLECPWSLDGLPGCDGPAEVTLVEREAAYFESIDPGDEDWFTQQAQPDGAHYLRWEGLFEFLISPDGRRIDCRVLDRGTPRSFQDYLLGQALSFALLRLGLETLHATAVVVDGGAVGLLGDSGAGKSSLGAALLGAGHPLLTDDLLALEPESLRAHPGLPRVKLFPEIAATLGHPLERAEAYNDRTTKAILPLRSGVREPVPLRALYLLDRRAEGVAPVTGRRALLAMQAAAYNSLDTRPERMRRLFALGRRLVDQVPIRRIAPAATPGELSAVAARLLEDLA